jgi:hypothetical protein
MTTARVGVDILATDKTAAAFNSAMGKINRYASVVSSAVKGFAVGFASTKLLQGLQATIDKMDGIAEASQRMGVATEAVSRLGYAAQLNGGSMEVLEASAKKLNQNLSAPWLPWGFRPVTPRASSKRLTWCWVRWQGNSLAIRMGPTRWACPSP